MPDRKDKYPFGDDWWGRFVLFEILRSFFIIAAFYILVRMLDSLVK